MAGNKPGKPTSKRKTVRLRHKIEKASAQKQRKSRKQAKANPEWRSKLKKDPGIPNLFPYKDKILAEIEESRRRKVEDATKRRTDAKAAKTGEQVEREVEARMEGVDEEEIEEMDADMHDVDEGAEPKTIADYARAIAADQEEWEAEHGDDMEDDEDSESESDDGGVELRGMGVRKDGSRKAFDKVFKQVVDQADVVLYVLDARDPEGTRSKEVERMVMAAASGGKRLILILNKIDLIPPPVLKAWILHLQRYFPVLPLRASGPAANAHTFNHKQLTVQRTSATLFNKLKSFAEHKQLKRAISVGVIGYPNVGKSSVINALTSHLGRGAGCPVGAEAGVTTSLREVKIDSKLKLLDSPGLEDRRAGPTRAPERHSPEDDRDPVPAVTLLLKRLSASEDMMSKLMDVYKILPYATGNGRDATTGFLIEVARKRGRLGPGGVPNLTSAATAVITDWRDGRIQGWIDAPVIPISSSTDMDINESKEGQPMADQKEIVTEWAAEFKLEGLWGDGKAEAAEDSMQE
ncbi:Nuclear GTP-binding protein NUG1 [Lachnellula suecica]|uniref:Nuclear GTP-binding protein NUG1 n=1 Tax=Lachnellula suecica TaxID=602035 RepID=A0A8T9C5F5_9HELO|nr:Nuclear GTP-binding protein NUG1 [Lachnellula suecica]